jgi:hypothetical protein
VEPEILAVLNQQGLPIVVCEPAVSFLMRAATAADEDCNNRGVHLSVEFAGLESRAWLVGEVWVIADARFYPPLSHVRIVAPGELLGEVKRSFPDVGPTPFEYGARAEYPFDLLAVAPSLVVLKHREGERIEHDMQVRAPEVLSDVRFKHALEARESSSCFGLPRRQASFTIDGRWLSLAAFSKSPSPIAFVPR